MWILSFSVTLPRQNVQLYIAEMRVLKINVSESSNPLRIIPFPLTRVGTTEQPSAVSEKIITMLLSVNKHFYHLTFCCSSSKQFTVCIICSGILANGVAGELSTVLKIMLWLT